ncbi:hypothetical protein CRE_04332 [Caenorhabditis remanei]|uniref:F-box domain-containing protein n=1 Tax=Caenorhabditis remanei TaxID=31234 RepID=E3NGS1_CAERE|nr:hypothetical protein CRE_04332 [Caenorhabditis remanei]
MPDDVNVFSKSKRKGFVVGDVDVEDKVDGAFALDALPVEIVAKIGSQLGFNDVVSFRQSSQAMNQVYREFRGLMKGPEIHVFVNIEEGQVVTSFRGHRQYRGATHLVSRSDRPMIFRNAEITLTIRLGETPMTPEVAAEILETFEKSQIVRIQLRAESCSWRTKDLINELESPSVELNVRRYHECIPEVRNLTDLKIRQEMFFFQLQTILVMNLPSLSVHVTIASLPKVFECINEWRESRRDILSWFFKIPFVEINPTFPRLEIDWRRSVMERIDRTARLRMHTRIGALEEGDAMQYQTISWVMS